MRDSAVIVRDSAVIVRDSAVIVRDSANQDQLLTGADEEKNWLNRLSYAQNLIEVPKCEKFSGNSSGGVDLNVKTGEWANLFQIKLGHTKQYDRA